MDIKIRKLSSTEKDFQDLRFIGEKTFREAYEDSSAPTEIIDGLIEEEYNENRLRSELADQSIVYFMAYNEEAPIGFSKMVLNAKTDFLKDKRQIYFNKNYVMSDYQGKGIGKRLLEIREAYVKENKIPWAWLKVWSLNHRGIAYHNKNGFKVVGEEIYEASLKDGGIYSDLDLIMVKEFSSEGVISAAQDS